MHCQKLISTLWWIIGGLLGLFIGSVRRLPAEADQNTVVDVRRGLASSWLAFALLLRYPLACW